jgi:hypothetical protein
MKTPCIIITRDRADYTERCLASLERFEDRLEIHIVDHGSTWEPMLDWLAARSAWGVPVHYRPDRPPRALWGDRELLQRIVGGLGSKPYLVTDPDLIFDEACPDDWLEVLRAEMVELGGHQKVGMGLRVDDLPPADLSCRVRDWEGAFWREKVPSGRAWRAPVDTTLALYPGLGVAPDFQLAPAARLDAPYLMRHLPWYETPETDTEELAYYRAHVLPGASHWANI